VPIAFNWVMIKSYVIFPIPRTFRPKRAIENIGLADFRLDAEDMRKLAACAYLSLQVAQDRR
jgi:diketogulonate reductase-like aldo/keto reductase